eukprot:CAMPEP_0113935638 /NCGR_PEP_ID=MMETSP1339-20121228/2757_1 /TAXON_ID=94617 /ORGANISM="Fibrocapsa japonica" /LENGTH=249 /DNA_ID=CAMNT_0000937863 /DNA_START=152 /DNA_END=901 /DNA_ORIENTATION=- /assembly_acc=CAM_ASM_000762
MQEEGGGEELAEESPEEVSLWLLNQVHLLQNRAVQLSTALRKEGLLHPVTPILPEVPDRGLEVAQSSRAHPYPCRIFVDAEDCAKVVSPCKCKGSSKWIQWSALNWEMRHAPDKWQSCPTCRTKIDYSQYRQWSGTRGQVLTAVLDHQKVSAAALALVCSLAVSAVFLVLETPIEWVLLNGPVWNRYHILMRFIYLPLPFKILIVQFLAKKIMEVFGKVENKIRDRLIELEGHFIEQSLPVTITAENEH